MQYKSALFFETKKVEVNQTFTCGIKNIPITTKVKVIINENKQIIQRKIYINDVLNSLYANLK